MKNILAMIVLLSVTSPLCALDTSGCSVDAQRQHNGPVAVSTTRAPWKSCWNFNNNGILVEYTWSQLTNSVPQKNDIGFWVSLNSAVQYQKAQSYKCERPSNFGYGADTSGNTDYACTATAFLRYGDHPDLFGFAYDQSGHLNVWDMKVAVSLDSYGNWDSLNGSNYSFRFN
ncbi:MAG: hypothetical protein NTY45_10150 [Elusimicrobia bacterium]|nr:hypothetical protein [Elusimicrobiota bacterium]